VALEVYYQGGDDFLQSVKDSCHHPDNFSGDQEYSLSRFGRLLFRSFEYLILLRIAKDDE
jgi:hypothetical protein